MPWARDSLMVYLSISAGVSMAPIIVSPICNCLPSSGSSYRANGMEDVTTPWRSMPNFCFTTANHALEVQHASSIASLIDRNAGLKYASPFEANSPYSRSQCASNSMVDDDPRAQNTAVSQGPCITNSCSCLASSVANSIRDPRTEASSPRPILASRSLTVSEEIPKLPLSSPLTFKPITSPLRFVIGPPLIPPIPSAVELPPRDIRFRPAPDSFKLSSRNARISPSITEIQDRVSLKLTFCVRKLDPGNRCVYWTEECQIGELVEGRRRGHSGVRFRH